MSVAAAYLGVILIWSTTPLAIKWSSEGSGFLFGVTGRMLLGTIICLLVIKLFRIRMHWNRKALYTYASASMAIFGSMMSVYWGSQFISSGLLSVLFGMTPLLTGLFAAWLLKEHSLSVSRLVGIALGIAGLVVIFRYNISTGEDAIYGVFAVLFATTLHSLSTVLVKKLGTDLPGMVLTTGSLSFSSILLLITWFASGSSIPVDIPVKASASIIYLGVFGSVIGFTLYYYALRNLSANHIGLIPLITPVAALMLGHVLNREVLSVNLWVGSGMILTGLVFHQWGSFLLKRLRNNRPVL